MEERKRNVWFFCDNLEKVLGESNCCGSCHTDFDDYDYPLHEEYVDGKRANYVLAVCCDISETDFNRGLCAKLLSSMNRAY